MRALTLLILAGMMCALVLANPAATATQQPSKTTVTHSTVTRSAWPPESLSGTITMIDPKDMLVVVKGPNAVLFDMVLTQKTRIRSGSQSVTLDDLGRYQNKEVSVQFVPERRGDVAESIRISG